MPRYYCRHQKYEAEKAGARLPRKPGRKGDIQNNRYSYLVLCITCVYIIYYNTRVIRVDVYMYTHHSEELGERAAPTSRSWQDGGTWAAEKGNGYGVICQRVNLV